MGHNFQLRPWTLALLVRRTSVLAVGARRRTTFLPGVLQLSSRRASWLFIAATACRVAIWLLQPAVICSALFLWPARASDCKLASSRPATVVKCYRVVYRCFERARQWLNRWLGPKSLQAKCYLAKSEQRLLDTSCRSPQTPSLCSSVGIVALLGPTRTSAAALQAQRRVRNARGSLFEASDAACTSRIRRTSGVKREGASTADGAAS